MAGRSTIARRLRQLGFGGVACCVFSSVVATSVSAQQAGASQTLQVAAWNLRHLTKEEAEELKDKPKPTRRKWRNTFGAERRTPSWRKRTRDGFDADIVALQGLKTVSEVRRIFPATTHQLIMSRAALSELQGEIRGARENDQDGFTAIVIRSRAGLRVAGQHYFTVPALGPSLSSRTAPVIALRLSVDRDAIWVLSVEFRSNCGQTASDGNPDCDGQRLMSDAIVRWVERTRAAGTPIIAAGSIEQLKDRLDRQRPADAAQKDATDCAETKPGILLITGDDDGTSTTPELHQRPAPKKRPCVARADIRPIGRRPLQ